MGLEYENAPFIAVDWGTTNRRAYLLLNGIVVGDENRGVGAGSLSPSQYPDEIATIRRSLGDYPILCAGMVGSRIGWRELPYTGLPAGIATIAAKVVEVAPEVRIIPGVARCDTPQDVMRGEEVQLLGAVLADLVPDDAIVCQPGTHSKWARIEEGKLVDFVTAMTGELFALLRDHSLLASQLGEPALPGPAFAEGVDRGRSGDLPTELFQIRAAGLLGKVRDEHAGSQVSGLLIGCEVAARLRTLPNQTIYILDNGALGSLYASAVEILGGTARLVSSRTAFCAGTVAIRSHLHAAKE
jgi:2-dehydro-3-deoxygalactonokinase